MNDDMREKIYDKIVILHNHTKRYPDIDNSFTITLQLDSYGSKTSWKDIKSYHYKDSICHFTIEYISICNDNGLKYKKRSYYEYKKTKGTVSENELINILETRTTGCSVNILLYRFG
jgi:hypothetical protein